MWHELYEGMRDLQRLAETCGDLPQLALVHIHRDQSSRVSHQLCKMRRLASGCGAEVEHDSTARRAGEEGDSLCSGVLHGPLAILEPRKQARLTPSAHKKRTGQRRRRLDARTRCLELLAHRLESRAAEVHAEGESGGFLARGGPCRERRFGRKRRGHVRKKILGEGAPNGERLSRGET